MGDFYIFLVERILSGVFTSIDCVANIAPPLVLDLLGVHEPKNQNRKEKRTLNFPSMQKLTNTFFSPNILNKHDEEQTNSVTTDDNNDKFSYRTHELKHIIFIKE